MQLKLFHCAEELFPRSRVDRLKIFIPSEAIILIPLSLSSLLSLLSLSLSLLMIYERDDYEMHQNFGGLEAFEDRVPRGKIANY